MVYDNIFNKHVYINRLACTFSIEVYDQVLEYVHVSSVSYGAGGRGIPLAVDEPYGLSANIENQRVHQRHTVLVTRITRYLNERVGGGGGGGRGGWNGG